MLSISFSEESKSKLLIVFDKLTTKYKLKLINIIDETLAQYANKKYFIVIYGVGGTIENLLEEMKSNNCIFDDKNKNKFFTKKLDELYLMTEHQSDLEVFERYIGSFNEGSMHLYFINSNIDYTINLSTDKSDLIDFINKNSVLKIDCPPDGEVFEIEDCNEQENLMEIYNNIGKFMLGDKT